MDPTPIEQTQQFLTGDFRKNYSSWDKIQPATNNWTEPQQKVIFGYLLDELGKGIRQHSFFFRFDPRQRPKIQQLANYLFQHFDHLKFNLPLDDFHEIFIKFLFLNNHINILRLVPGRLGQGRSIPFLYYYFVVSPEALQLLPYGYRYPFVGNNTDRFLSTLVRKNKITEQHQPLGILKYFFQQKFEPNPVTQQPLPQLNQPIITEINRMDRARWAMGLIVACISNNNQVAYKWLIPKVLARLLRKKTTIVKTPPDSSPAARAKFLRDYLHVKKSGSTVFCKTLLRAIFDALKREEVTPERQFMLEDVMQRLYKISKDLKRLKQGTETIPVRRSLFKHLFKTTCGDMHLSYQKIIMHATIVWRLNYHMPSCKLMKYVYDTFIISKQSVYNCYGDLLVEIKGKSVDEILQFNFRYFSNLFYRAKVQEQQPYPFRFKRQKPTYTMIQDTNSPEDAKKRNACFHAWAIYYLYHHVYDKTLKNAASWDIAAAMEYILPIAIGNGWTLQSRLRIFPQRMNASGTHHLIQMNDKTMVSVPFFKNPVILWDIPSGTKRRSLRETLHKKYAMDKIDEDTIAIGNSSGNIMVYDITRKSSPKEYGTKTNIKIQAVLTLNANTLISANYNQTLREWQQGSPRIVGSTTYGVKYLVKISDMVFVAVFFIGSFQIWKKTEDQYISSGVYKSPGLAALIRWDDTTFVTGDKNHNAVYIHQINPNLTTNVTSYPTNIEGVESIVKLSENQLAVATWSGAIRIITRDNGIYRHDDLPTSHDETMEGTYVAMLLFDNNTLITASEDIFVWTLSDLTKKPIVLVEHKQEVQQLIRLNDDAFASSARGELIIWKGIQNQER